MTKTVLNVRGMSCGSCVAHIEQALAIDGVASVTARLDDELAIIEHDPTVSIERLIATLRQAGYPATPHLAARVPAAPAKLGGCCC